MRGRYLIITVLAITCGAGAASWRADSQINSRIEAATQLAAMEQSAAEEKANAAELALGISESAERFARDELAQETKKRIAAEQALDRAIIRTAQAVRVLADQGGVGKNFEGNSADAEITKDELVVTLSAQGTTKKAMESKLEDLDTILNSLDEIVAKRVSRRRNKQTELDNTKVPLRDFGVQPQQSTATKARKTRFARRIASRRAPRRTQTWWQSALRGL